MKLNKFTRKAVSLMVSAFIASSLALSAGAWSESPADGEAETTTSATTEAVTTEETTTTTEPEAVLDDEIEEDPEDTSEEIIETEAPEETTPAPETTTAAETTAAATTAAPAAANTVAPDSYNAVEPFKMYVPEVLNVRGGPGTNYDKLGQVYANNVITIIGTSGDWYVFDYYGADGYLLAELLTEVPETSATTSAPPAAEDTPAPKDTDVSDEDISIEDTETTEPSETETTTKAPETEDADEDDGEEDDDVAAAPVTDNNDKGSIPPVLLAAICAILAFLLIGVLPVLLHKAHHKKIYQY